MTVEDEPKFEAEDVDEFAAEAALAAQQKQSVDAAHDDFFSAGTELDALDLDDIDARAGVLDRLGPAHFRSKEFRFMGFLQTVYNHVAEQVTGTIDGSRG